MSLTKREQQILDFFIFIASLIIFIIVLTIMVYCSTSHEKPKETTYITNKLLLNGV
jgi:hypothetical protein